MNKYKPVFIAFEGIDGSGKSTISSMLAKKMSIEGHETILTREPCGTNLKYSIKDLIKKVRIPIAQFMLFEAERLIHINEIIEPSLKKGINVITDRFFDSSLVYQGISQNVPIKKLQEVHNIICQNINPNITFYCYADNSIIYQRISSRRKVDLFENEIKLKMKKYKDAYDEIYKNKKNVVKIDTGKTASQTLTDQIFEYLQETFYSKNKGEI